MSKWYERLTEIRSNHGYSQSELADLLDVHLTAINRYEKGRGASSLPNKFKIKLLQVFSKDEVEYIEYGEDVLKYKTISQSGNGNIQHVGNGGSYQTLTPYDKSNLEHQKIMQETLAQVRSDDLAAIDREIVKSLKYAPQAFKENILKKLEEFKKMSEL